MTEVSSLKVCVSREEGHFEKHNMLPQSLVISEGEVSEKNVGGSNKRNVNFISEAQVAF